MNASPIRCSKILSKIQKKIQKKNSLKITRAFRCEQFDQILHDLENLESALVDLHCSANLKPTPEKLACESAHL